jgi:hypothetical protein
VGEHHTLRLPRAAAAEDDRGEVVHRQRGVLSAGPFDQPGRGAKGEESRDEFVSCADRAGNVFQPQDFRPVRQFQLSLLGKDFAGHDCAEACEPYGCFEAGFTDRIVQIHAGFPAEKRCHIDECAGDGRRKQNADMALVFPMWPKRSGEDDGSD